MKDAEIHGLQNYFIGVSRTVEVGVGTEYDRNYNQKKKKKKNLQVLSKLLENENALLCFALCTAEVF